MRFNVPVIAIIFAVFWHVQIVSQSAPVYGGYTYEEKPGHRDLSFVWKGQKGTPPSVQGCFEYVVDDPDCVKVDGGFQVAQNDKNCACKESAGPLNWSGKDNIDGFILLSAAGSSAGGSVSGDPVTFFRGIEYKFDLPNFQLTTLIQTKDVIIRGSAFQGEKEDEQWIDTVLVETIDGEVIVEVSIRKDIANFTSNNISSGSFDTVEIKAPWLSGQLLPFPTQEEQIVRWGSMVFNGKPFVYKGITFDLIRVENPAAFPASTPKREGILLTTSTMKVLIMSTSAFEYYWDDKDGNRALKYAHLDLDFLDLQDSSSWTGLLPEVWGLAPKNSKVLQDEVATDKAASTDQAGSYQTSAQFKEINSMNGGDVMRQDLVKSLEKFGDVGNSAGVRSDCKKAELEVIPSDLVTFT